MPTNDTAQDDLFGLEEADAGPGAPGPSGIEPLPPLAIPCGYRNRSNAPCRRLGFRPVIIDGELFHHRGCRIVHCDPACFRDEDGGSVGDQAAGRSMSGSGGGADRVAG